MKNLQLKKKEYEKLGEREYRILYDAKMKNIKTI